MGKGMRHCPVSLWRKIELSCPAVPQERDLMTCHLCSRADLSSTRLLFTSLCTRPTVISRMVGALTLGLWTSHLHCPELWVIPKSQEEKI